ncbi:MULTISPECIES: alpha/beta hydrolase [Burkholderiaceae]|uniref:alpha/beta fold hydrolase n=1 Tax=Burkholderiaceae TaxID=119060 RepID=UPI00142421EC|nr:MULTISPECIES: alpha/beta hydrolase [Burkholderiaceae]NIF55712.1 alpha/beta hydrolase [Burkholderia sp. Ax-1724]NIF78035.1 alpha/beta hydrolase [Paraburkholderia sp. Cy-641]
MASHTEPGDGKRMLDGTAYHVSGSGEPLVLIHGVGMNSSIWAPQIAEFEQDHTVIALDFLGHGGSSMPREDATLDDYVEQTARLLHTLGIERATVVGHSMGALIAIGLAGRHPERVGRLIAMNAVFERTPEQREAVMNRATSLGPEGALTDMHVTLGRWLGTTSPEPGPAADAILKCLSGVDANGYARAYRVFASSDRAHVDVLPQLDMPALYLTGELDANSSPAMSVRMAGLTPRGVSESLDGERHMMAVVSPQKVNRAIRAFLDQSPRQSATSAAASSPTAARETKEV